MLTAGAYQLPRITMNPSTAGHEAQKNNALTPDDSARPLTDLETATILQSLREAVTDPSPPPAEVDNAGHAAAPEGTRSDLDLSLDLTSYPASHYWDASTMAPLSVVSAVSIA